jgi:hypothetical protein
MDTELILICTLTALINLIGALAYAARIAGVRTGRIALSFAPELRPGGFATARISSGSFSATVLPESAVQADANGSYVYIVDGDNKAVRRPVKTGAVTAQGLAITEGLSGNERVVLKAGGFLNPGESVNPQPLKK